MTAFLTEWLILIGKMRSHLWEEKGLMDGWIGWRLDASAVRSTRPPLEDVQTCRGTLDSNGEAGVIG